MADNREVGEFELFDWTGSDNPSAAPATVIGENYSATAIFSREGNSSGIDVFYRRICRR